MTLRKCDDCTEHKGIEERLNAGDRMMERFEKFMEHQTKRSEQILIGIIFLLLTGIFSIGISVYQYDKKDCKKLSQNASIERSLQNQRL